MSIVVINGVPYQKGAEPTTEVAPVEPETPVEEVVEEVVEETPTEESEEPVEASETEEAVEIDATDGALELAEEMGIDLSEVVGTGKDGRILKSDVEAIVENG